LGMVGAVDHRAAAVDAGIGCYGQSGLLLTREFGPRVRLGSVLTSMKANVRKPSMEPLCPPGCTLCLKGCPAGALQGDGRIDKHKCGNRIFEYGLRGVMKFIKEMAEADRAKKERLLQKFDFRDFWQNFMTGNYYYCFECQNLCPAGTDKYRSQKGKKSLKKSNDMWTIARPLSNGCTFKKGDHLCPAWRTELKTWSVAPSFLFR